MENGSSWKSNTNVDSHHHHHVSPACPRCGSSHTKFCYYNNYSLTQPRYFCKGCRRYWTKGGSLRNVPIGGGCRKSRRSKSVRVVSTTFSNANSHDRIESSSNSAVRGTDDAIASNSTIDLATVYANFLSQKPRELETSNQLPQDHHDSISMIPAIDQFPEFKSNLHMMNNHQLLQESTTVDFLESCGYNFPPHPHPLASSKLSESIISSQNQLFGDANAIYFQRLGLDQKQQQQQLQLTASTGNNFIGSSIMNSMNNEFTNLAPLPGCDQGSEGILWPISDRLTLPNQMLHLSDDQQVEPSSGQDSQLLNGNIVATAFSPLNLEAIFRS